MDFLVNDRFPYQPLYCKSLDIRTTDGITGTLSAPLGVFDELKVGGVPVAGSFSVAPSDILSFGNNTLTIQKADGTHGGYVEASDVNRWNASSATGGQLAPSAPLYSADDVLPYLLG